MGYQERKDYIKKWNAKNPEKVRHNLHRWYLRTRKNALILVGRGSLKCVRCGTERYELLEINHKNGYGNFERKHGKITGKTFYRHIVIGKRDIDDLEILCRPCNMVHAAEMMGGPKYKVIIIE